MEKLFDINEQGVSVRCKLYYNKDIHDTSHVAIATHGFGGFKENKAIEKFAERLTAKYKGYAVVCFDWPCHGMDARKKLVLDECLLYLCLVVDHVRDELKAEKLYVYSTSFGGYLTLLYIAKYGNPFTRIALRCPAIRMYETIDKNALTEDDRVKLTKGKEVLVGHERKIKIGQEFLDDLKANDVSQMEFFDCAEDCLILHGTKDDMVPFADSEEFADANVIEFVPVEKADHRFQDPKTMDFAIQKIVEFFAP